MNLRISPRKIFQNPIIFEDEFGREFIFFKADNISTSGVFVRTESLLQIGTKALIKFYLGDDPLPIRTAAVVTRQFTKKRGPGRKKKNILQGVGLKFTSLKPEDFARLCDFIENP